MLRLPRFLLLALAMAVAAAGVSAEPPGKELRLALAVESQLARESLAAHTEARRREEAARQRLANLHLRLDELLSGSEADHREELLLLDNDLAIQTAAVERWSHEAMQLRSSLIEHWRRIELLDEKLAALTGSEPRENDGLSGSWSWRILPSGQLLAVHLQLDVTVVTGSYRGESGVRGSLRGTLVGAHLRLERIDAQRGFDVVYEGELDRQRSEIRGTWGSTLLTGSDAPAGTWIAQRTVMGDESEPR